MRCCFGRKSTSVESLDNETIRVVPIRPPVDHSSRNGSMKMNLTNEDSASPKGNAIANRTKSDDRIPANRPQLSDPITRPAQDSEARAIQMEFTETYKKLVNDNTMAEVLIPHLEKLLDRFEKVAQRLEAAGAQKPALAPKPAGLGAGSAAAVSGELPNHVREYDDAMDDVLGRFKSISQKVGGDCEAGADQVTSIFGELRNFLWKAAGQAEPDQTTTQKMLQPVVTKLTSLNEFKDSKRNTVHFNHLSAMAEGIQAVGWVSVKPTPAPFVKDMLEASQFYSNRVLKDYKDSDPNHVEWAKTWAELLSTLQTFVRKTHTTGLVWNSAPGSAPPSSGATPSAPGGAPPPPPPPPPIPADLMSKPAAVDTDKAGRNALFKELNQGKAITTKLKKVTSEMQTHKNPELRAGSTVPATAAKPGSAPTAKAAAPAVQKPPRMELENGKQWMVEYYKGDKNVTVNVTDKKQTVYIFKCENSTIRVCGKANSIILDQCKKSAVCFDSVVAQAETINCQSVQLQTMGELPTLSIQKTDGCQVYLSEVAKAAEIVTSKSSEMNVLIPDATGEFIEYPIPEQFKTIFKNGKLETTISDIC